MKNASKTEKQGTEGEEIVGRFDLDTIERELRGMVQGVIENIMSEELALALGAKGYERVAKRLGYRNGTRPRTLTTSLGPTTFEIPRARISSEDGGTREWRPSTVERYERRSTRLNEAILGVYLGGTNTRRVKVALAPLLRGGPLGKDAVSRLAGRTVQDLEAWRSRDLAEEKIVYLYFDGFYPKVRVGKRRERVPVLATMGVTETGQRVLIDLRQAGAETAAAWSDLVGDLVKRNIGLPHLAIVDGNSGLTEAIKEHWPGIDIQRCTKHKVTNLLAKVPKSMTEELAEDYRRMIYAPSAAEVQMQRKVFIAKWKAKCPEVVRSLEEAGEDLFTFTKYPKSQWKALRTTNAIERINEEFRRRIKTQAMLPSGEAVLSILFGLLVAGYVTIRRIDGHAELPRWRKQSEPKKETAKEAA